MAVGCLFIFKVAARRRSISGMADKHLTLLLAPFTGIEASDDLRRTSLAKTKAPYALSKA